MFIYIVDRKRYPVPLKTIFFDLVFRGNGGPIPMLFILSLVLFFFIICLRLEGGISTKYFGYFLCPLAFLAPFLMAFISYNSKFIITADRFCLEAFGISYRKGNLEDLIELHHLIDLYGGSYRVRVRGKSPMSGFLIHWKYVPEPLKYLPVLEIHSEK